jgi:hypothetical protein
MSTEVRARSIVFHCCASLGLGFRVSSVMYVYTRHACGGDCAYFLPAWGFCRMRDVPGTGTSTGICVVNCIGVRLVEYTIDKRSSAKINREFR